MSDRDLEGEIEKLQFQVRLLGEAIDSDENPIAALVTEMNWGENDLNDAHDIFEEVSNQLNKHITPDFGLFEEKLKDRFDISYQGIKPIVLAFYQNSQWLDVCEWYVRAHTMVPMEFREIAEAIRERENTSGR